MSATHGEAATLARVRDVARRLRDRLEGFDPLDFLAADTLTEAEQQGYLDGLRAALDALTAALDVPSGVPSDVPMEH